MDGFRRMLGVCSHSADMSLSADHIPVFALQFRVGRNHGRVPPDVGGVFAFGGDVPFGGSHPCIRPTILRRAEPKAGFRRMLGVCSHLAEMSLLADHIPVSALLF